MFIARSLFLGLTVLLIGCSQEKKPTIACSPPLATWPKPHPHLGPEIPLVHVAIDRNGSVYFQGSRTTVAELPAKFDIVPQMGEPEPATILETEMGAPCATLDRVRSIMNERLKCDRGGHCDEGIQSVWKDLPSTGNVVP